MRYFHNRIILVDGHETYFLAHWISDSGIIIEVSGPDSLILTEHEFTELDGSPLQLDKLNSAKVLAKQIVLKELT